MSDRKKLIETVAVCIRPAHTNKQTKIPALGSNNGHKISPLSKNQWGVTEFISHAVGQASCFGIVGQDNMNLLRRSWPAQNELYGFFFGGESFLFCLGIFFLSNFKTCFDFDFLGCFCCCSLLKRESSHFQSWVVGR